MAHRALALFLTILGLVPCPLGMSAQGRTASEMAVKTSRLVIAYKFTERRLPTAVMAKWEALCDGLADRLKAGRGPGGLGAFSDVSCDSSEASRTVPPVANEGPAWLLELGQGKDRLQSSIFLLPPPQLRPQRATPLATFSLPSSDPAVLEDPVRLDLWALAILDALPVSWLVPKEAASAGSLTDVPREPAQENPAVTPLLPTDLILFTLFYDFASGYWRAEVLGKAEGRQRQHPMSPWHVTWHPTAKIDDSTTVFGQRTEGRGKALVNLLATFRERGDTLPQGQELPKTKELSQAGATPPPDNGSQLSEPLAASTSEGKTDPRGFSLNPLWRSTLSQVSTGFAGLRFGVELVDPSASALPPKRLIGVLAEFRSGLAKGLRIYWDYIPVTSVKHEDERLYFGYNRLLMGYGFNYEVPATWPTFGLKRVEIAPKIGAWSVDAQLPFAQGDGDIAIEGFHTKNTLGVGLLLSGEFSLGSALLSPLLRPWYARDFSSGSQASKLAARVTSQRIGLDLFWHGPRLQQTVGLSFLLFAFHETIAVSNKGSDVDLSTAYGGAGVTLDW